MLFALLTAFLLRPCWLSTNDFDLRLAQLEKTKIITAEVTAYNENDWQTPGRLMANGEYVRYGIVANDVLPLGSQIEIDGEVFTVADRFGAGHPVERFDIYLPSTHECEKFGRQIKTVKIREG